MPQKIKCNTKGAAGSGKSREFLELDDHCLSRVLLRPQGRTSAPQLLLERIKNGVLVLWGESMSLLISQ